MYSHAERIRVVKFGGPCMHPNSLVRLVRGTNERWFACWRSLAVTWAATCPKGRDDSIEPIC
jgi:hypothetical protein